MALFANGFYQSISAFEFSKDKQVFLKISFQKTEHKQVPCFHHQGFFFSRSRESSEKKNQQSLPTKWNIKKKRISHTSVNDSTPDMF